MFLSKNCLFWWGFLAEKLPEIVTHLVQCLPCIWTFQYPGTDKSPLFRGVTTHTTDGSVQLRSRKNRIGRCLYFCRVTGHCEDTLYNVLYAKFILELMSSFKGQ